MKNILITVAFLVTSIAGQSQKINYDEVDVNALVSETQLISNDDNLLNLYWWIPLEYWRASFAKAGTLTEKEINEFIAPLEGYTILAVVEGQINVYGTINYVNAETLRQNVRMISIDSTIYSPIAEDELESEMTMLLAILKPMMANMLGEMGSNINFFVFHNQDKKGNRVFSPFVANSVRATNQSKLFKWRTPLGSLLPKKKCPNDGELLNGAWDFCPYHGDKLDPQ